MCFWICLCCSFRVYAFTYVGLISMPGDFRMYLYYLDFFARTVVLTHHSAICSLCFPFGLLSPHSTSRFEHRMQHILWQSTSVAHCQKFLPRVQPVVLATASVLRVRASVQRPQASHFLAIVRRRDVRHMGVYWESTRCSRSQGMALAV